MAAALVCSGGASAGEQQDQGASIHGTISTSVSAVGVHGDEHKYQAVHDAPDGVRFGIDNFTVHMPQDGWSLDASGSLLQPGYYKLNLNLKKPDLGFVQFDLYQFDTYDDGSLAFYPFAPFVYQRGGDVVDTRRNMGVTFGWTPADGPDVTLRLEQWRLHGERVLYRGGQVEETEAMSAFPQIEDQDQTRNRAILAVEQDVGNWHYRIAQMYENFNGTNDVNELRFDDTGALDRMTPEKYRPRFDDWTTTLELYGDLIKDVLRLDFSGEYVTLDTRTNYTQATFNADGTPRSSSRNYSGNRHHGDLQRLLGNLRLTYTPNDIWTLWAGIGRKDEDDDNHSVVNVDETLDGVLDGTTVYHTSRHRDVWMYNAGARVRPLDWLVAEAEGRWERGDVRYHWRGMETLGGDGTLLWIADEDSDRDDYTASVTVRPVANLKLIGRAKHSKIDGDYTNIADLEDGVDDPTHFPGFIGDYNRIMDELAAIVQYRALSNLYLAYKFVKRTEEFRVLSLADEDTGDQTSVINSLSVNYTPCERLTLSAFGSATNYEVRTQARNNPTVAVPRYDGDANTLGLDASLVLSGATSVSGGLLYTRADSVNDQRYGDLYLGLSHQISDVWTLNCRGTYSTFDESSNGGINDYHAKGLTVGLTGRF